MSLEERYSFLETELQAEGVEVRYGSQTLTRMHSESQIMIIFCFFFLSFYESPDTGAPLALSLNNAAFPMLAYKCPTVASHTRSGMKERRFPMSAPSSALLDAFLRRMACNGFMGGGFRDVSPALIPSLIWRLNRWQPGRIDLHW